MNEHRKEKLDTNFEGQTYESIVWHAACHYRAQQIGPKSSQLMQLTGAKVQMVERCAAIDGTWGLRAENIEMAKKIAKPLMERVRESRSRAGRRRLPARERRDPGRHAEATVAPACRSWRARTASRKTKHEEADTGRHQGHTRSTSANVTTSAGTSSS